MTMQTVLLWASRNAFIVVAICFGVATLMIILYTYVHDYVLLGKSR